MQPETGQLDPYALLRELEQRSQTVARGLPMQEESRDYWRGVGFVLGGHRLLAPLEQVDEILTVPAMTRVPLVKSWVLGLANVRGNLLPVMDLGAFLGLGITGRDAATRVLAVREGEFFSGLMVGAVTGLQQIDSTERSAEVPETTSSLEAFLDGSFRVGDELVPVFDFTRLATHPGFLQAAA
ncbi:MAG: chemotaxis protein CheW [Gammaproteobacteria bacterium]|nr:chemotaxis protein CheW [Gammaproteobacteria bacterium]